MSLNLDTLRTEIQEYLESRSIVVFHSDPRAGEAIAPVYWDTERYTDYRMFLKAAEAAGVRLVTLFAREFTDDLIDDSLEQLAASSIPREDRRVIEMRLREMRGYSGFTCQIELSFDLATRVYIFDLRTEWYDDLHDLLDRVEGAQLDEEDRGPLGGGYFSKN